MVEKDLFIGSGQLAHFWPKKNTEFVDPRRVDLDYIVCGKWNRVYIAFADGRTNLTYSDDTKGLFRTNVDYTLDLINNIQHCCRQVVFFSTTELWNCYQGALSIDGMNGVDVVGSFNFDHNSPYINSKAIITTKLLCDSRYNGVIVLFPFSFNSAYRREQDYLFCKVFRSIIWAEKIPLGNVNFYRDITHPRFVVEQSLNVDKHTIIGSGRLTFVRDFIDDLYFGYGMDMKDWVVEDEKQNSPVKRNVFYLNSSKCLYLYKQLYEDTINDIQEIFPR